MCILKSREPFFEEGQRRSFTGLGVFLHGCTRRAAMQSFGHGKDLFQNVHGVVYRRGFWCSCVPAKLSTAGACTFGRHQGNICMNDMWVPTMRDTSYS